MIKGEISTESEVKAPAAAVWEVYGGLGLANLVDKLLSDVVGKVEIVNGDGGVGTIAKITFPDQTYMKEIFTLIDNHNRIKETEVIEGGFIALPGFHSYKVRLEIIHKDDQPTSIIRSTVFYEVDDEQLASLVDTKNFDFIATVIGNHIAADYLNNNNNTN